MLTKLLKFARFANALSIDVREVCQNILDDEVDFEVDGYRFIHEDSIDEIMQDEIGSDEYVLGGYNATFLADATDISLEVFESMQNAGAYEAVGKLVKDLDKLFEVQQSAVAWDGYGQHFSHYDGSEESCEDYHVFRVN